MQCFIYNFLPICFQEMEPTEGEDLSIADPQSAAFSQLSQSELGGHKSVWRYNKASARVSAASSMDGGSANDLSNVVESAGQDLDTFSR